MFEQLQASASEHNAVQMHKHELVAHLHRPMHDIQELHWIDAATRAVVWDLLMYNPNTDYFQNLRVLFEFSPSGIMAFTSSVSVHNLNLYPMKT